MAYSTRFSLPTFPTSDGITTATQHTPHDYVTLPKFVQLMSELGVAGPRQRTRLSVESSWYEELGQGGQFQVYKHTEVALVAKRVKLDVMVKQDATELRDLELEIRALAKPMVYEHPNIINLLDWGYDTVRELPSNLQDAGRTRLPLQIPVLYIESANEGSLAKFLETSRDWATRTNLCIDIAAGLECLRNCRILHNDLKPDNVLVFRKDEGSLLYTAKLADFGSAVSSDKLKDLNISKYGATEMWWPPESIDYSENIHGMRTFDLLFKSESFAYGMLALFTLFSTHVKPLPRPFEHDPLRRRDEIMSCIESNEHLASTKDMTEAWIAIETSFLAERPESRRSVSPSGLKFSNLVPKYEGYSQNVTPSHTSARRASLFLNTGWRFYANMQPQLYELLEEERSKGVEDYPGDLLFGMALSRATAKCDGFHEDVKTLIQKAASASPTSIRAKGLVKKIEAAIAFSRPEEQGCGTFADLCEAAETGSIIAWSEVQKENPDVAAKCSHAFRCRGGYNSECISSHNMGFHPLRFVSPPGTESAIEMPISSDDSRLHLAAAFGVCTAITELVSYKHQDLNSRNIKGETPLYKACMAGQYEAARILLNFGADPCICAGRTEVSCLHWLFAFEASHMPEIAQMLTSRGLGANGIATPVVSVQGQEQFVFEETSHYPFHWPIGTPLHWAAHMENLHAVSQLVSMEIDVDTLDMPDDEQAQTALSMAMYRGSATMVKHLLGLRASPTKADGRGRTPLHMLAGDLWMQNRLFKIPSNLHQWCQHGSFNSCLEDLKACVEAVKDAGAPLDSLRNRSNRTPLADAIEYQNVCAVIALLEAGANANTGQDSSGKLPLHLWLMVDPNKLAYPEGYFHALEKLIHATAKDTMLLPEIMHDVVRRDSTSWRQKLCAFEKFSGHLVDVNVRDRSGMTLLMVCIECATDSDDCLEDVKWMHERGATVAIRDNLGRDHLWYAAHNREIGDKGCLGILESYLEDMSETSKTPLLNESKNCESGRTSFMAMCSRGYYNSVRFAIRNGANLNDHDKDGFTALDITLEAGNGIRLALWDSYLIKYRRLPTKFDRISDDMFQKVAFGDSANQSKTSHNNMGTDKKLYMTFPELATYLIKAGARTGKQLGHRDLAPDIKYRERQFLEVNGINNFVAEDQPFYGMWKQWYQYDDTTKKEDEAIEANQKGWSIPLEIRKLLESQHTEEKSSSP